MNAPRLAALAACAIAMFCLAFVSSAQAKGPEDVYMVKDGQWTLKATGEEPEGWKGTSRTEGILWIEVDSELEPAAAGLKPGLLLYDPKAEKGKAYTFLQLTDEQNHVDQVAFGPGKETMVVSCYRDRFSTRLYVYDVATLKLEHTFVGYTDVWFVDSLRFAFTAFDPDVERPDSEGTWGTSAAIYEPAEKYGYVVLKQATATESFAVTGADADKIEITVTTVPSPKDWEDFEKQKKTTMSIEVPAAG
jgi:hypothetical protein